MPHINIKHYPHDFTDGQKRHLAEAITHVITEHFDTYEGAVSIALEPVAEPDWNETVHAPQITVRKHLLIKEPNDRD